jgi:hypothetical protein
LQIPGAHSTKKPNGFIVLITFMTFSRFGANMASPVPLAAVFASEKGMTF